AAVPVRALSRPPSLRHAGLLGGWRCTLGVDVSRREILLDPFGRDAFDEQGFVDQAFDYDFEIFKTALRSGLAQPVLRLVDRCEVLWPDCRRGARLAEPSRF